MPIIVSWICVFVFLGCSIVSSDKMSKWSWTLFVAGFHLCFLLIYYFPPQTLIERFDYLETKQEIKERIEDCYEKSNRN